MQLYNKKLVDPYMLAARGLVISTKHLQDTPSHSMAVCVNSQCSLQIEFDLTDGEEEPKDEIEDAVVDHDAECPFGHGSPLKINCALMREIGYALFQQRV
jgi:hypothetical protein